MASIYDKYILSKSDLERVNTLNDAWKSATDKKQKNDLHAQAEAIRNLYGYSGGDDGSQFILNDSGVLNTAAATRAYTDALEQAKTAQAEGFDAQAEGVERDKNDRLREAYIKNMQDSLGIGQKLKAAGVSGGASESTVAYMNNVYNNNRNDIIKDALEQKTELSADRRQALAAADADIAKAEYDATLKRADALKQAEQTAYERELSEYEKQKDARDFEYNKAIDLRDFEYQKAIDERDFEYKKQQDEYAKKVAAAKAASGSASSSSSSNKSSGSKLTVSNVLSLVKAGVYSPDFADILGITDDQVRDLAQNYASAESKAIAWELLDKGIYDSSFPELLGYSEEMLLRYLENVLNGY